MATPNCCVALAAASVSQGSDGHRARRLAPRCPTCHGIVKPTQCTSGANPAGGAEVCFRETRQADCMLVAGTSALVYPAASFPQMVKQHGGVLIEANLYDTPLTPLATAPCRTIGEILPTLVEQVRAKLTA